MPICWNSYSRFNNKSVVHWLEGTEMRYDQGKRFTKMDIAYEIGRHEPYHPASLYWDSLRREELAAFFNDMFGTDIE